ncbi:DNA repair protein RadA [Candidatus Saccharibacteria bacterium]|nr:DNA repair protein RadA [Candidatus Saccharibacteria bacterium]
MAKKGSVRYVCNSCGAVHSSWMGRCSTCGEWNTITEELDTAALSAPKGRKLQTSSVSLVAKNEQQKRLDAGEPTVNDVLGGGFVPGSVILIAGQPGIGKSTLMLQIAYAAAKAVSVLYISGEESVHQVGLRAKRLGVSQEQLQIASSTSADDIAATIASGDHALVVVDSIQTVSVEAIVSAAGTVSQITNSTYMMMQAAKRSNTALLLVGHVTKEGSIAGPKVLEHVVDVVLQLEGDRYGGFKVLRSVKNRFGNTNESAIFEMKEDGLQPVENPSAALLAERQVSDGSVVLATLEGARPLLVEVQALVNTTSYGYPKRAASGIDLNRVNLLIAMLEKRTKLNLADKDIYINIVGGLKITEPAADLAICMAIASASKGMQLKEDAVVFGEVGLSGEVRRVPYAEKRIAEAKKLGFSVAIAPKNSTTKKNTFVREVIDIRSALNSFLSK